MGLEPTTPGLGSRYSTIELCPRSLFRPRPVAGEHHYPGRGRIVNSKKNAAADAGRLRVGPSRLTFRDYRFYNRPRIRFFKEAFHGTDR